MLTILGEAQSYILIGHICVVLLLDKSAYFQRDYH